MKRLIVRIVWVAASILGGCGYHSVDSAVHLPSHVHTLAVPDFANHTQWFHGGLTFSQAVVREFASRTPYRTLPGGEADATLSGSINRVDVIPLTYNSQTGQSSSYLITMYLGVKLTDRAGRVLYQNEHYMFREQYQTTQDPVSFVQEDTAAVDRLARNFAQSLVSDILESF